MRIFVQAIHVFAYMFTVNVESSANHFLLYVRCFARFVAITIQNLCNASILTKTTLWEWISCMVGSKHCPSKYWRNAEERFTKPISHVQICNTITEGKNIYLFFFFVAFVKKQYWNSCRTISLFFFLNIPSSMNLNAS